MISRLRLRDFQLSGGPPLVGICASDTPACATMVNRCQERLLTCREAGEEGWFGTYAEMVFNVDRNDPYITLPRGVARLISATACQSPIPVRNQFYEYLRFGNGTLPKQYCQQSVCGQQWTAAYGRNTVATTFAQLTTPGYGLRFYSTSTDDAGKRLLIGGLDSNGQKLFSVDGTTPTTGYYVTLTDTFVDLTAPGSVDPLELSQIDTIQKDTTEGVISIYEVNLTTGDQNLLLQMEPSEQVAFYQRYYLNSLPTGCCAVNGSTDIVQVTAMVKLDLVPAKVSTDFLLIQSMEALIAEAQATRFSGMESAESKAQVAERHREAIRYLQGQLVHYTGKTNPAVNFAPFGTARLSKQRIGYLR